MNPAPAAKPGVACWEEVMRSAIVALSLAALGIGAISYPAAAEKSKMGCEMGQETWNAASGKCEPGKSKWAGKSTAKKAPAKK